MNLKDISETDLLKELDRRKNVRHRAEIERRREEERIYNLPENVAARKKEADDRIYSFVLRNTISRNNDASITEDTDGVWTIFGEDPNCDMGGSHHEPNLGKVQGTLKKAILHALTKDTFVSWGGGGHLKLSGKEKITKL